MQLFDSWAGAVSPEDYRAAVLPHSKRIFEALAGAGVPRIHFGVGTGELLRHDERGRRGRGRGGLAGAAWTRRAPGRPGNALQGNLDPAVLLAPWEVVERRARDVLGRGRAAEGTCSTWATACCRRPTPMCWPG